ncbi:MAG: HAMP domain-containing sensor histidine kinase [Candidatus Saccharibacteria bacterium]
MQIKKRYFGLRIRFTLLVSALLFLTFVIIAFFLVRNAQSTDIRNINADSRAFSSLATPQIGNTYEIYSTSGSIIIDQQIQTFLSLDGNISNVAVIGLNGKTDFRSDPNSSLLPVGNTNGFNPKYSYNSDGLISQVVVPYLDNSGQHPYSIAYKINASVLAKDNQKQIKDIILFSIIGLIITALIMYELIYRLYVKPVELMSRQAIYISQGNYGASMNTSRHDEIGDLAASVNTMSERLKADILSLREVDRLKTEFINITSHNLRTPLTIMQGNIQLLNSSDLPKDVVEALHNIEQSSSQLAGFAEDMLNISTIEAGQSVADRTSTTLEDLVKDLREKFSPMAEEKGLKLDWQIHEPDTKVNVAIKYTKATIRCLLDNAVKFTEKDGSVKCRLSVEDNSLKIVIEDSGIGISTEEQTKLFTKFHRGTDTLTYNYTGTGIGLYVAKLMTESQHGTIKAHSEQGTGSIFTVTIPGVS